MAFIYLFISWWGPDPTLGTSGLDYNGVYIQYWSGIIVWDYMKRSEYFRSQILKVRGPIAELRVVTQLDFDLILHFVN